MIALVFSCLVMLLGPSVVSAQSEGAPSERLTIDRVDARDGKVVIEGSLVGSDPAGLSASISGEPVGELSVTTLGPELGNDVIAVIDNAGSLPNAAVQLAKQALEPLMPGQGAVARLGVVSTGGGARLEVGMTANPERVRSALESVRPVGSSATWDAVTRAGELLEGVASNRTATVVLFTAAAPSGGAARPSDAGLALQRADARLEAVILPMGVEGGQVSELVRNVGGSATVVRSDEAIDEAIDAIADTLAGRFTATFTSDIESGTLVPLVVSAGGASTEVGYTAGFLRVGPAELAPITGGVGDALLSNEVFKWLGLLLAVTAAVLFIWAVVSLVVRDRDNLTNRLEVYDESFNPVDEFEGFGGPAISVPIIQRAVDITGEIADQRDVREKAEIMLERANLPLRAPEAIFFLAASAVAMALIGLIVTGSPLGALVAMVLAIMVPIAVVNFLIRKRQKEFVSQLPDMLTLLAGTLRAGYSIGQGFESVSGEVTDPMGKELRRVVTETRLGRPLEDALEAVSERMDSDDFAWAVMAIKIQREVGGNLAELLLTVADTMTQRERLRRDVSTLTAEGKISAIIIGLLPPGLGAVMFVMNPEYIGELFTPGIGYALIITALISMGIGFAWMKKTIEIEV